MSSSLSLSLALEPKFDGPFTLSVHHQSRVIPGTPPPRHWDYYRDGGWELERAYVKETSTFGLLLWGIEFPVLSEDRKRARSYVKQFDPEDFDDHRSGYDIEGFYGDIVKDLNRLWTTMGPLSFLSEYLCRLQETPPVLDVDRRLIKRVEEDRDYVRGRVNFIQFLHSETARTKVPTDVVRLIGRFVDVI